MRKIEYLVVHCSATKPSMDVPVSMVKQWHLDRGWSDIGYHYYIRRDGTLRLGRKEETTGAHVKGYNRNSIGVCYEGGLNEQGEAEDNRTEAQKLVLKTLLLSLKHRYPKSIIQGHRDFEGVRRDCPCFDAKNEYKSL